MPKRRSIEELMAGVYGYSNVTEVARNTIRYKSANGNTVYRLHTTDILIIRPDGSCVINTNGWNSPLTMDRLNQFKPFFSEVCHDTMNDVLFIDHPEGPIVLDYGIIELSDKGNYLGMTSFR